MKKIVLILCAAIASVSFASLSTANARAVAVFPPQSVTAGATVTNAAVAVFGFRGIGELTCCANAVAAASSNRIVTVTLQGTNTVSGGWKIIDAATAKGADALILRVPFHGEALPPYVRTIVNVTTANTIVGGAMLGF